MSGFFGTASGYTQAEIDAMLALKLSIADIGNYDEILEYDTYGDLPVTGDTSKLYVITTDGDGKLNSSWRWSGSTYVQVWDDDFDSGEWTA